MFKAAWGIATLVCSAQLDLVCLCKLSLANHVG